MMHRVLNRLVRRKTDSITIQFFRSVVAGGIATVFDFATLYSLTEFLNVYYLVSAAFAFGFGVTVNYTLCTLWVFSRRRLRKKWLEFVIFAIIGIVGLSLNELIIWFFTEHVHFYYLLSKVVSTIIVFTWNFLARKFMLFR